MNVEYWTEGGYSIQPPSNTAGSACAPSLTACPASGNLSFPKVEGVAVAFAVPHTVKRAVLLILATSAPHGRGYILARRRPDVRETQAASTAGERRLASFFVTATNSQQ